MSKLVMNSSQIRIIAGRWRGRKISFPTNLTIRPTPDRIRETVFNWLSPYLVNRVCLDLYAGSGALGFEALSRGAIEMVFVDSEPAIIKNLKSRHTILNIDAEIGKNNVRYHCSDALKYLSSEEAKFDLVFLDPPYQKNMIKAVINQLNDKQMIKTNGLIYIEMAKAELMPEIPVNWHIIKSKVMGQVASYLLQLTD